MVDLDLVSFFYYSEASRGTHVVAVGGAIIPVVESVEQIAKLKNQTKTKTKEKK
jgi:hypothetical protein